MAFDPAARTLRTAPWTSPGAHASAGPLRVSRLRPADGHGGGPGGTASLRPTWTALLDALVQASAAAQVTNLLGQLVTDHGLRWGAPQTDLDDAGTTTAEGIDVDLSALGGVPASAAPVTVPLAAVMHHVASVSLPVVWDAAGHRKVGVGEFHTAVSDYVARKRISMALRAPAQRRWRVDFATDPAVLRDRGQALPLIVQTQLLATHLNEAAQARCQRVPEPSLSNTEVNVLRWTLAGRTAPEIGHAMGISGSLVAEHANAAVDKLGCAGKHHAAVRALHRGWLLP